MNGTQLTRTLVCLSCSLAVAQDALSQARPAAEGFDYPKAKTVDQVDDFHGAKVNDPYRWLEDLDDPDTRAWIEAENRLTFDHLKRIEERSWIRERLEGLWDYEKFGVPLKEGGRYFYSRNDGLQNHSVIYTLKSLSDTPRVLIDPNTLSKDGTVSMAGYSISKDGKYMAYAISDGGSDWREWKVREVETGRDLEDHIKWSKFSGATWTHDNKGFFYSRYDEPKGENELKGVNYFQKLWYHRVGTPQSQDELVYHRPDQKEWGFGAQVTNDGRYLIIYVSQGTLRKNMIFYKDLTKKDAEVVQLIDRFEAQYHLIDSDGPTFWFFTDLDAPRGRVVAIDTRKPDRSEWKEIIPESRDTLRGVSMIHNTFVANYLKDARSQVKLFDVNGKFAREVRFPGMGSVFGFDGKRKDTETFYAFTGYTAPLTIYRYDMVTGESTVFRKPEVDFDPDDYVTQQIFYKSKDGTFVPMFITHARDLRLDGRNPTYLYGYGGFNIPITPSFSVSNLVWLEMGGIVAVANLRGGGEYGSDWHQAGTKLSKQNVFDDFIAAAEWLIDNEYTSTPKLAIAGGSNGGLLVGACMTQRPNLFGACLPAVGVLDMLRFHKFTIGWAWTSDYGSPDNPEEFKALRAYSPLHNIRPGTAYPATMITTGDHDDRVFPAHSFKFAAALQAAQSGPEPVMIRIETRAGHGAGKPTSMRIEEAADRWAFLVNALEVDLGTEASAPVHSEQR